MFPYQSVETRLLSKSDLLPIRWRTTRKVTIRVVAAVQDLIRRVAIRVPNKTRNTVCIVSGPNGVVELEVSKAIT